MERVNRGWHRSRQTRGEGAAAVESAAGKGSERSPEGNRSDAVPVKLLAEANRLLPRYKGIYHVG